MWRIFTKIHRPLALFSEEPSKSNAQYWSLKLEVSLGLGVWRLGLSPVSLELGAW
jgi:hypothetical protein